MIQVENWVLFNSVEKEKDGDTKQTYQTYSPVPYNIEFELNILSKNNEDSVQILEQILPYFQPVFNITINLISKMSEKKDIPIVLNSVGIQDDYEADFLTRRTLIHTLSFTAKTYLYGPVTTADVIRKVNVDISAAMETGSRYVRYSATPAAKVDRNRDGTSIRLSLHSMLQVIQLLWVDMVSSQEIKLLTIQILLDNLQVV